MVVPVLKGHPASDIETNIALVIIHRSPALLAKLLSYAVFFNLS